MLLQSQNHSSRAPHLYRYLTRWKGGDENAGQNNFRHAATRAGDSACFRCADAAAPGSCYGCASPARPRTAPHGGAATMLLGNSSSSEIKAATACNDDVLR